MKLSLKKHPLAIVGTALPVSLILLLASTYAWFTAAESVTNNLSTPQYQFIVEAVDVFTPPTEPLKPGSPAVGKDVGAVNTGQLPGFVRLMALPTVIAADGATVLPASFGHEVVADFAAAAWVDGQDGYYYYLKVLPPGDTTDPKLFSQVKLAADLDQRYDGATLTVEVKSEAIAIAKWSYRVSWWGSAAAPAAGPLATVDAVLQKLAV
jgi:predicted ribosomally synthesized peptide with SipW-like signal peptide